MLLPLKKQDMRTLLLLLVVNADQHERIDLIGESGTLIAVVHC